MELVRSKEIERRGLGSSRAKVLVDRFKGKVVGFRVGDNDLPFATLEKKDGNWRIVSQGKQEGLKMAGEVQVITGLRIMTESGEKVGFLESFEFEPVGGLIQKFMARKGKLGRWFWGEKYIIGEGQVARIESNKIVIKDGWVKVSVRESEWVGAGI